MDTIFRRKLEPFLQKLGSRLRCPGKNRFRDEYLPVFNPRTCCIVMQDTTYKLSVAMRNITQRICMEIGHATVRDRLRVGWPSGFLYALPPPGEASRGEKMIDSETDSASYITDPSRRNHTDAPLLPTPPPGPAGDASLTGIPRL